MDLILNLTVIVRAGGDFRVCLVLLIIDVETLVKGSSYNSVAELG